MYFGTQIQPDKGVLFLAHGTLEFFMFNHEAHKGNKEIHKVKTPLGFAVPPLLGRIYDTPVFPGLP